MVAEAEAIEAFNIIINAIKSGLGIFIFILIIATLIRSGNAVSEIRKLRKEFKNFTESNKQSNQGA